MQKPRRISEKYCFTSTCFVVFVWFSGEFCSKCRSDKKRKGVCVAESRSVHGKSITDGHGFENDGKEKALVPVDAQKLQDDVIFGGKTRRECLSLIVDDDILRLLGKLPRAGVMLTCVVDSCHSETVLDLPYCYTGGGDEMERDFCMISGASRSVAWVLVSLVLLLPSSLLAGLVCSLTG